MNGAKTRPLRIGTERRVRTELFSCSTPTSLHLVMDDLAVNHRKDRADLFDLLVLHAEIILVENSQIRQFTSFDRADLIFNPQKPTVSAREKPKNFLPCDLLVAIHSRAE